MSAKKLEDLRRDYPGRTGGLRAEEVAYVLGRPTSRGAVQRVREGMQRGRYPGARKIDGHWHLPLEDLAEILEPTPEASPIIPAASTRVAPSATGRRKSAIGPRLAYIRAAQFWASVFRVLGEQGDAQAAEHEAEAMRAEGRLTRDIARAEEQARALHAALAVLPPAPSRGRGGGL